MSMKLIYTTNPFSLPPSVCVRTYSEICLNLEYCYIYNPTTETYILFFLELLWQIFSSPLMNLKKEFN
jgi:hypothetical protein